MIFRKATAQDIPAIAAIFSDVHTAEESGTLTTGWLRNIYPTQATAETALARDDLFVLEDDDVIVGSAIINQIQVDVYQGAPWRYDVPDSDVMVLHTLAISPRVSRNGYGRAFVGYYEAYARENGCLALRIDTNERNTIARSLYKKLGYWEIDTVPCVFNGLPDIQLVLLEKYLGSGTDAKK